MAQLRSKRVFSTFPIKANRIDTLGIQLNEDGFIPPFWVGFSKQRKNPGWRRSSKSVQNALFRLSPSGRSEYKPLGSNSTRSVSYHHFVWAFPSSTKSWSDESRPIALKTRFFDFPHRGQANTNPWDRIPRGRFHSTILGGLLQAAQKAGLTKVAQLRSKPVFVTFLIGAKRINTLGMEYHVVGFMPPFWVGFSKQCKQQGWGRSSTMRSKCVYSIFTIGAKRINTHGIEFYEVGIIPQFWVGYFQPWKKPCWPMSSNCVRNEFFRLSPSGRRE